MRSPVVQGSRRGADPPPLTTPLPDALRITLTGFAPGLFWLWYIRRKDRIDPEPRDVCMRVFGLGCVAAFVCLGFRPLIDHYAPVQAGWERDLIDAFLLTALTEEVLKLLAFLIGVWWFRHLDEPLDGVVYGAAAALGFASAENVFYLTDTGDPSLIAMRAFTATLAHVGFTGSLCFSIAVARLNGQNALLLGSGALLAAIVFHGGYNLFLWRGSQYTPLALLFLLPLSLTILSAKVRWSRKHARRHHRTTRFDDPIPAPELQPASAPVATRQHTSVS